MDSSVVCLTCNKSFSTTQTRNLNIRKFHNVIEDKRVNHIICPLCKNNEPLGTTANFEKHLQETHEIKMEKMSFKFGNKEQYEKWKIEEKMEVNYAINRTKKTSLHKEVHYACNRSDSTGRYKYLILLLVKENYYFYLGYIKNYKVRTEKAAGSIKISGICPSRYIIKKFENGSINTYIHSMFFGIFSYFKVK
jgi:hypothetical protein